MPRSAEVVSPAGAGVAAKVQTVVHARNRVSPAALAEFACAVEADVFPIDRELPAAGGNGHYVAIVYSQAIGTQVQRSPVKNCYIVLELKISSAGYDAPMVFHGIVDCASACKTLPDGHNQRIACGMHQA